MKAFVAAAVFGAVLAATPASATHDTIYTPCSTEYGYIHMTYEEWSAEITAMEADGTIPPGVVFRYWEANHTTGLGTNVQEDGTIPAWDQWAQNLTDGQILSIDDWLNGDYPEIEALNFSAGKVPEWVLDANMTIRRVDDPYWAQPNPLTPSFSIWGTLCMADLGYSIPLMEINDDGVWVSNLPTTTTTTISTVQSPCQTSGSETQYDDTAIHTAVASLVAVGSISSEHVSVTDYGVFIFGMAPTTLVVAGLVQETALDHTGLARHYTDAYWEYQFDHLPNWSFWEINCAIAAVPATTTTTTIPTGSTSDPTPNSEATPSTTTQAIIGTTPTADPPVTTTTVPAVTTSGPASNQDASPPTTTQAITVTTTLEVTPEETSPTLQATPNPLPAGYDLWTAQYEGWPFMETVILLEERYPQGTLGKYHFRLSTAVEFLRADGMIGQLDSVWNSNGG